VKVSDSLSPATVSDVNSRLVQGKAKIKHFLKYREEGGGGGGEIIKN
jgi:hypothetical protein